MHTNNNNNHNGTPSPATAPRRHSPASGGSGREDCWSEEATFTLVDAWGRRYLECNRGNLRQRHWQEVADAINARHHQHTPTRRRTDIQCKNRIDTLKKKYKIEKAKVEESGGNYVSPWPFFAELDRLIGNTFPAGRRTSPVPAPPALTFSSPVPVAPRSATQKRPAPVTALLPPPPVSNSGGSKYHGNFSAFAAAAAAVAEAEAGSEETESEDEETEGSEGSTSRLAPCRNNWSIKKRKRSESEDAGSVGGCKDLNRVAEAIEKFAEVYERVESSKQKQMIELEKQRMEFAKDLERERMQLYMETQMELFKLKRAKN